MRQIVSSLMRDARGTSAIEYAIIASLIAVVIVGAIILIGQSVSGMFGSVSAGF